MNFIISVNAKHFLWNENYIGHKYNLLEIHKLGNSRYVKILSKLIKFIITEKFAYSYHLFSNLERGGQKIKYCHIVILSLTVK